MVCKFKGELVNFHGLFFACFSYVLNLVQNNSVNSVRLTTIYKILYSMWEDGS